MSESHYLEKKYVNTGIKKGEIFSKGGFNCGFWGEGRGPKPPKVTPGIFHKVLNWFTWRENYFGNFFTENSLFQDRSKITEYGVGGIIMDRFSYELIFYFIFAFLGLVLGGPKVVTPDKKPEIKPKEKEKDEEEGKTDEDKKKGGKDKKPPKAPINKKEAPLNKEIPSVTQPGIGSFFSCARFLTGYSLGMNLIFSGVLEILNHAWREEYNVPLLSTSFCVACAAVIISFMEYIYLLMVSLAGDAPVEIDDMASLKSGSVNGETRNNTRAPSKTNSDDGDGIVKVNKRGKDKFGFFLRGSLIFNHLSSAQKSSGGLKPGQKLNEPPLQNISVDTLSVYYMCVEYSAANMKKDYNKSSIAKIYNFLGLTRTLTVLLLVYWVDFSRIIQAWSFLTFNMIYLVLTMIVGDLLEFKGLVMFKELLFFLWSVIIVINAHDDISPTWELFIFWIFSLLTIIFRFLIMMIEIIIFIQVIQKACVKNSILNYKKNDIRVEESYVQQGYNEQNEPLETEERGLNYDKLIHDNIRSLAGSRVQGIDFKPKRLNKNKKKKKSKKKKKKEE